MTERLRHPLAGKGFVFGAIIEIVIYAVLCGVIHATGMAATVLL
jgi:hypothetical protein